MQTHNLYAAKTHLSQLVQAALDGEEVYIARAGKPAVRLVPVGDLHASTGGFGCMPVTPAELVAIDAAFSVAVDAEVAALFMGDKTL